MNKPIVLPDLSISDSGLVAGYSGVLGKKTAYLNDFKS